jgi:hypothetical protein
MVPGTVLLLGVLFVLWISLVVAITSDSRIKRHMHRHHV